MRIARSILFSAALLSGCEELREIGSQCTNDSCESLSLPIVSDCLVTSSERQLIRDLDDSALPNPLFTPDANGLAPCDVFWIANDPQAPPAELLDCTDYLEPAPKAPNGAPRCRVKQLPARDGTPPTSGAGIYYIEHLPEIPNGSGFRYTSGISVPDGVRVELWCTYAKVRNSAGQLESIDPDRCLSPSRLAASNMVGDSCLPDPAPARYDFDSAYLDTAAPSCGAGACLTFHLDGHLLDSCQNPSLESCLEEPGLSDRSYCSCRCDAPAGDQPECECPNGFACVPTIEHGPFAGSYCVLSSTVALD